MDQNSYKTWNTEQTALTPAGHSVGIILSLILELLKHVWLNPFRRTRSKCEKYRHITRESIDGFARLLFFFVCCVCEFTCKISSENALEKKYKIRGTTTFEWLLYNTTQLEKLISQTYLLLTQIVWPHSVLAWLATSIVMFFLSVRCLHHKPNQLLAPYVSIIFFTVLFQELQIL